MSADVFRLSGSEPPWGDYGDILLNGMTTRTPGPSEFRELSVERAGPFVPPISFPFGTILVTEEFRAQLKSMEFSGLSFRDVPYSKIVRIDWRSWDLSAEEPQKYPSGGEPENYILRRKHVPSLAASMPKLSALIASPIEGLQKIGTRSIFGDKLPDLDFFQANMLTFVSRRAAQFLNGAAREWIDCAPASIVNE